MNKTNTAIAQSIVKEVKSRIEKARKWNKEHGVNSTDLWNYQQPTAEICVGLKHGWIGAKDERYVISIEDSPTNKRMGEFVLLSDLKEVISEVNKGLAELKSKRGWGTLSIATEETHFGNAWNNPTTYYPSKVTLPEPACKEFKALQNYLKKYANYTLPDFGLFSSAMGGKRGRLWDEYGTRHYLDNKPTKCARVLKELREERGSKDLIVCKLGREDYIDDVEQRYSEYHEVECEGEKRHFVMLTIKTPTGRVKYEQKIY